MRFFASAFLNWVDKYLVGVYYNMKFIPIGGILNVRKGDGNRMSQKENDFLNTGQTIGDVKKEQEVCCHYKATPREEKQVRLLRNRINRMIGQLNGINKMLEEKRYCGEVLTQIAAVESALRNVGYLVLQEHMETCVVEEIQKGNLDVVEEALELVKRLR